VRTTFLWIVAACATPTATAPVIEYPGALHPPNALGPDFLIRQRIDATFGDREIGFDAVVQKVGDKLTLLGLTPFGSRAFLLEQTGTEVRFERYVDRDLPFPPKYILFDLQRTLYVEGARADGTHALETDDERTTEIWKGGLLHERRVSRKDGKPSGELAIRYEGGLAPAAPPPVMHFHNGWFGYDLEIRTLEVRKL
jgi:hypothetical protein